MLSRYDAKPDEYPTSVEAKGRTGMALRLVTQSTGDLGAAFGKPIAAGNLFVGTFDLASALFNPLAATRFGVPVNRIPTRFSGYYKWQPGEVFTNAQRKAVQGPAPDGKDAPHIYAVVYRNADAEGNAVTLDGSNILSRRSLWLWHFSMISPSPALMKTQLGCISICLLRSVRPSQSFARPSRLQLGACLYLLARWAEFAGAIGSTLLVDDCRLTF